MSVDDRAFHILKGVLIFKRRNRIIRNWNQILTRVYRKLKQMKKLILMIVTCILTLYMSGCGQSDKSKILEKYKYVESNNSPDDMIKKKLDPWVKEGMICYGIVIVHDESKNPLRVKEVHSKIISIEPDKIRMRSLENIRMAEIKGCKVFSLQKGEDWIELEGDIFRTREDAIKFIDTRFPDLRMK